VIFLYSTHWANSPPIENAPMIQQAFSRLHSVNIIAANTGFDQWVSGGGIFSEGDILAAYFNESDKLYDKLLVASVPILSSQDQEVKLQQLPNQVLRDQAEESFDDSGVIHTNCKLGSDFVDPIPCALFSPKNSKFPINIHLNEFSSDEYINCDAIIQIEEMNSDLLLGLMASRAIVHIPLSDGNIVRLETCTISPCKPASANDNITVCSPLWDYDIHIGQFLIEGTNFTAGTEIYPHFALNSGQVQPANSIVISDETVFNKRIVTISNSFIDPEDTFTSVSIYGIIMNITQTDEETYF